MLIAQSYMFLLYCGTLTLSSLKTYSSSGIIYFIYTNCANFKVPIDRIHCTPGASGKLARAFCLSLSFCIDCLPNYLIEVFRNFYLSLLPLNAGTLPLQCSTLARFPATRVSRSSILRLQRRTKTYLCTYTCKLSLPGLAFRSLTC